MIIPVPSPDCWRKAVKSPKVKRETKEFSAAVGRALRRAAKAARKTARMHGTPIYIWKNGKVFWLPKSRDEFQLRSSGDFFKVVSALDRRAEEAQGRVARNSISRIR